MKKKYEETAYIIIKEDPEIKAKFVEKIKKDGKSITGWFQVKIREELGIK